MKVWAVKMFHKLGDKAGNEVGYHSVWSTKWAAERQCEIRNNASLYEYRIEEKEVDVLTGNRRGERVTRFGDSVGFMIVEPDPTKRWIY